MVNRAADKATGYIIAYKLILGVLETGTGIAVAVFGRQILHSYYRVISRELIEDPHDLLANVSEKIIPGIFTHQTFFLIYLLILGMAKIAGAIGLIYKQNWGVDLLVGLTIILLPFQIAEIIAHPSAAALIYMLAGILIAGYLIEFNPKAWFSRVVKTEKL